MSDTLELNDDEIALLDKPIKAIRAFRRRTGLGLKEAKVVVNEKLEVMEERRMLEASRAACVRPGRGWGRPLMDTCNCGAGLVWLGDQGEEGSGYGCPRCAIFDRDEKLKELTEDVIVLLNIMSGTHTHTLTLDEATENVRTLVGLE